MTPPSALERLRREPVVHFALLGAALFALHRRVAPALDDRIVVSAAFVDGLRSEQVHRTGKPPTAEEERDLVDRYVTEEVLYREAIALGLDRGDPIVRRRLAQKMTFLAEDGARVAEPSDDELRAHIDAHANRYREPPRVSFHHVLAGRDRRGAAARGDAEKLLVELRAGASPDALGDPFLQGRAFARRTRAEVEAVFGTAFAAAVIDAEQGGWTGPFTSSFGEHLVFVDDRSAAALPPIAAIRERARRDLLDERREQARKASLNRLRARYHVVVEGRP